MSNTIIVGYIPSPEGEAALDRALKEAAAHQSKLLIINVIHDDGSTIDNRYIPDAAKAKIRSRLEGTGADFELVQSTALNVADALLEIAEEHQAETIVLGLRKRSQVGKLILGSIAQRVLMNTDSSVLAVRV